MRKSALILTAGALLASAVHADWVLGTYPTVTADSAEVKSLYGPSTYANSKSSVDLTVPKAGVLQLKGTFRDEASGTYSANLGIIHPLTPSWEVRSLVGIKQIQFDLMLSQKPTEGVGVTISSKGYGDDGTGKDGNDAGETYGVLLAGTSLPAVGTWETIKLDITDFTLPDWWKKAPETYPSRDSILKVVEAIQISPKTKYSGDGVKPSTVGEVTMSIRNLTLVGVSPIALVNPDGIGCEAAGESMLLDDFADGDNANALGGYWYAFTDTSSAAAKVNDSARGSSTASMSFTDAVTGAGQSYALFGAGLHKKVGGAFDWRPYAGWASIGTGFEGDGDLEGSALSGIEFTLRLMKLPAHLDGINFKVTIPGVKDAHTHYVTIPVRQIDPASTELTTSVCVRPEDLSQPSWIPTAEKTPFSSELITKLAWEAKIADQKDKTIFDDSTEVMLTGIRLHGAKEFTVKGGTHVGARTSKAAFGAAYANGILSVQALPGMKTVSVVAPSGKVMASFDAKLSSKAVKLDRGTYFVVARGEKTLSRKIVVLR